MDEKLYWLVEFTNQEAEDSGHVFDDPERLAQFVKVNARDMGMMRIVVTSEHELAVDRVSETFAP